ncbi:MAG: hypothetical protein WAQ47_08810 [Methanosarcina flavescens]
MRSSLFVKGLQCDGSNQTTPRLWVNSWIVNDKETLVVAVKKA